MEHLSLATADPLARLSGDDYPFFSWWERTLGQLKSMTRAELDDADAALRDLKTQGDLEPYGYDLISLIQNVRSRLRD